MSNSSTTKVAVGLTRLLRAVRAISPQAEVTFIQVPDNSELWAIRISVGDIVLIQTTAKPPLEVIKEAAKKIEAMSQRALRTLGRDSDIPPSNTE